MRDRMLIYEVSANGKDWTEQWLYDKEVEEERRKGYQIRCSFCRKLEGEDNLVLLTPGKYNDVSAMRSESGQWTIVGFQKDIPTMPFPMNYCPKCGRRLS